jgi:hypothetical protein
VRGVVRVRDGTATTVLVAETTGAQASCADANRDGRAGVILLAWDGRHARTGERVPLALTPAAGEDIDREGRYDVTLRVGDVEHRLAVTVRALPGRRRRRRSRRGRRRR